MSRKKKRQQQSLLPESEGRAIHENDVYYKESRDHTTMRRVIFIRDGRVCYSTGGAHNRWCDIARFRKWLRAPDVKLVKDGAGTPSGYEKSAATPL